MYYELWLLLLIPFFAGITVIFLHSIKNILWLMTVAVILSLFDWSEDLFFSYPSRQLICWK